ncbi:MAG TPA: HEPN domain-containing protein [Candidatus Nanopelagicales bacterium]|nr:HEPN domain-containing protein [Candidatus Nanopelagicales bacterium]
MTRDSRREAIQQDLRQCAAAMKAARALRDMGLYNDALSRLYYALYHATTALLLTEGVEPRRHRAVARLLSTHFLPTGVLTAEDVAAVGRTQSYRDLADYERSWEATPGIADEAFTSVEPLIARIQKILDDGGWTRPLAPDEP